MVTAYAFIALGLAVVVSRPGLTAESASRGEEVQAGDVIARSGKSGYVSRPALHFEIRKDRSPWNPAQYLPLLKSQEPEVP